METKEEVVKEIWDFLVEKGYNEPGKSWRMFRNAHELVLLGITKEGARNTGVYKGNPCVYERLILHYYWGSLESFQRLRDFLKGGEDIWI
jgi:hypothetical protein